MQNTVSKTKLWTSYIMSGLVILFMLMDGIMKFVKPKEVIEGTLALGFTEQHLPIIGALGLISTLLYAFTKTQRNRAFDHLGRFHKFHDAIK